MLSHFLHFQNLHIDGVNVLSRLVKGVYWVVITLLPVINRTNILHILRIECLRANETASDGVLLAVSNPPWTRDLWGELSGAKHRCLIRVQNAWTRQHVLNLSLNGLWFRPVVACLFDDWFLGFPVGIPQDWMIIGFVDWGINVCLGVGFLLSCLVFLLITSEHHGLMVENDREIIVLLFLFCLGFGRLRELSHVLCLLLLDWADIVC